MGNCFGKPKSDNFSGPGRSLASSGADAPKPVAQPAPSPKPLSASYSPTPTQGRTVGGTSTNTNDDPRAAAALAAEVCRQQAACPIDIALPRIGTAALTRGLQQRRKASLGKGKLGKQLDAQKAQNNTNVLNETSQQALLARNADANAEARNWN